MKTKIEFSQFIEIEKSLEITLGKIIQVDEVPKSKILKLTIDFGTEIRTAVTNIKEYLTDPQDLVAQSFLFVTNLQPAIMKGIESTAMILPGQIESGKFINAIGEPGTNLL